MFILRCKAMKWHVDSIIIVGKSRERNAMSKMSDLCNKLKDFIVEYSSVKWMTKEDAAFPYASIEHNKMFVRESIGNMISHAEDDDQKAFECVIEFYKEEAARLDSLYLKKSAELDALCIELGTDDGDEALMVARDLLDDQHELAALKAAGRVMPEGVSWPRYDDGEPVRIGGEVAIGGEPYAVRRVEVTAEGSSVSQGDRRCAMMSHDDRYERPAPKAIGADGVEIKPGDTVWLAKEYRDKALSTGPSHNLHYVAALEEMTVSQVRNGIDFEVARMDGKGNRWCPTSWLTHQRPDSWERLREDAEKPIDEYWGCSRTACDDCPALVGGKTPEDRYGTSWCDVAMQLDIVARAERLAGVSGDAR